MDDDPGTNHGRAASPSPSGLLQGLTLSGDGWRPSVAAGLGPQRVGPGVAASQGATTISLDHPEIMVDDMEGDHGAGEGEADHRFHHDFAVLGTIGRGSFGHVLRAQHRLDGMPYAIKVLNVHGLSTQRRERMRREAQAMAAVEDTAHLVRYHAAWLGDGQLYIQTELCDGSLRDIDQIEPPELPSPPGDAPSSLASPPPASSSILRIDVPSTAPASRRPRALAGTPRVTVTNVADSATTDDPDVDSDLLHPHSSAYHAYWADQERRATDFLSQPPTSARRPSWPIVASSSSSSSSSSATAPYNRLEAYPSVGRGLSMPRLLRMLRHSLAGLRMLHEHPGKPIVHLDIKPDNILFRKDARGRLTFKLGDFGLAWVDPNGDVLTIGSPRVTAAAISSLLAHHPDTATASSSMAAPTMGSAPLAGISVAMSPTGDGFDQAMRGAFGSAAAVMTARRAALPADPSTDDTVRAPGPLQRQASVEEGDSRYLAPELLSGDLAELTKADIFSLGATALELALGRGPLPSSGHTWQALRRGWLPQLPPHCTPEFRALLLRMMAHDPRNRPSAADLLRHPLLQSHTQALRSRLAAARAQIEQQARHTQILGDALHKCLNVIDSLQPSLTIRLQETIVEATTILSSVSASSTTTRTKGVPPVDVLAAGLLMHCNEPTSQLPTFDGAPSAEDGLDTSSDSGDDAELPSAAPASPLQSPAPVIAGLARSTSAQRARSATEVVFDSRSRASDVRSPFAADGSTFRMQRPRSPTDASLARTQLNPFAAPDVQRRLHPPRSAPQRNKVASRVMGAAHGECPPTPGKHAARAASRRTDAGPRHGSKYDADALRLAHDPRYAANPEAPANEPASEFTTTSAMSPPHAASSHAMDARWTITGPRDAQARYLARQTAQGIAQLQNPAASSIAGGAPSFPLDSFKQVRRALFSTSTESPEVDQEPLGRRPPPIPPRVASLELTQDAAAAVPEHPLTPGSSNRRAAKRPLDVHRERHELLGVMPLSSALSSSTSSSSSSLTSRRVSEASGSSLPAQPTDASTAPSATMWGSGDSGRVYSGDTSLDRHSPDAAHENDNNDDDDDDDDDRALTGQEADVAMQAGLTIAPSRKGPRFATSEADSTSEGLRHLSALTVPPRRAVRNDNELVLPSTPPHGHEAQPRHDPGPDVTLPLSGGDNEDDNEDVGGAGGAWKRDDPATSSSARRASSTVATSSSSSASSSDHGPLSVETVNRLMARRSDL